MAKTAAMPPHKRTAPPPPTTRPAKKSKTSPISQPTEPLTPPATPARLPKKRTGRTVTPSIFQQILKPTTYEPRRLPNYRQESTHSIQEHDASRPRIVKKRASVLYRATANTEFLKKKAADEKKKSAASSSAVRNGVQRKHLDLRAMVSAQEPISISRKRSAGAAAVDFTATIAKQWEIDIPSDCRPLGLFGLFHNKLFIRTKIWRYAVVQNRSFIFPAEKRGREQPDLAMTCTRIREEVLPIYYRDNHFAVDVSARTGQLGMVDMWARAMKQGGWMGMVGKFCFQVEIQLPEQIEEAEEEEGAVARMGKRKPREMLFVEVKLHSSMGGAGVELHRQGLCLLPGRAEYGLCVLNQTPEWMNRKVVHVLYDAGGRGFSAGMIVELGQCVEEFGEAMVEFCCIDPDLLAKPDEHKFDFSRM